ncbi:MAG: outer membrane lipoprotein carrier protein LolA [Candidatus Coprovivens sp.]
MKRILFILVSLLLLTGCGSVDKDKVINSFVDDVESAKSYKLLGDMEIYNDEDTYTYEMEVYYMDDNYFKVNMLNTINKNKQVILRDKESVYVVTPSLNKSYKFTSEWPYNSSQAYILNTLVEDINNDSDIKFEELEKEYVLEVDVNYPNNGDLKYQKLYFNKNLELTGVDVFDNDDILSISVKFKSIDYKAGLDKEDFNIDKVMESECINSEDGSDEVNGEIEESEETTKLEDIIYPLYIPADTYLKDKETINTENGERVILTFNGAKNFVLIEESSYVNSEFETVPVYGDPLMITDTIGVVSSNSLSWSDNEVNYYLASNDMSTDEILTIANSLNVTEYVGK